MKNRTANPNPAEAKSDAATVMPFDALKVLLKQLEILYDAVQQCSSLNLSTSNLATSSIVFLQYK